MDEYYQKYIKYKEKYLQLKNSNNILVGGAKKQKQIKKCSIDDTDKVLFGDGGSSAIVVITKSIVSLLYGISIENKHIKLDNLDDKIYNFFNNYKLDKNIKIKHLLNMTSGINWQMDEDYDSTNNATYQMEHSEDWIEFIMNSKMKYKPLLKT